ncbi:MAG: EamA family transporter [Flavobacteriaceae bacterium]|nr:MAG: EamA family transporter [Flavobacteriaceae bacterium]
MLISAASFSLLSAFVKYLTYFNAYQLVFFRSLGTLILTSIYLRYFRIPYFGKKKVLLIIRGFVGVISMTLFFMALKYLTLGSAITLRYLAPIFATIFAAFLLKEKSKPAQWLFFIIAFSGVLVLKGFDSLISNFGLLLALASAIFSGSVYVIIRKIGKTEHPVVIINYFMGIATIFGGLLCIPYWKTPIHTEWLVLCSLGIFGFFGQLFMTKAFQIAKTNRVAPLKYIEVIFTALLGIFWLGEIYTIGNIVGILLILVGLTFNFFYKPR